MNIYVCIREFYGFLETNPMPSGAVAWWFALLHTNNDARWTEWFAVASSVLSSRTGLDRKGINRARNTLKQKGLIDFKPAGNKATRYTICYAQNGMANDMASDMASDMANGMAEKNSYITSRARNTKTKTKTNSICASRTFTPPGLDEVKAYCVERRNGVDAARFVDFYASKGWMVGKNNMKDWKAAVRTWERSSDRPEPSPENIIL